MSKKNQTNSTPLDIATVELQADLEKKIETLRTEKDNISREIEALEVKRLKTQYQQRKFSISSFVTAYPVFWLIGGGLVGVVILSIFSKIIPLVIAAGVIAAVVVGSYNYSQR